jgi:hypothetical protein
MHFVSDPAPRSLSENEGRATFPCFILPSTPMDHFPHLARPMPASTLEELRPAPRKHEYRPIPGTTNDKEVDQYLKRVCDDEALAWQCQWDQCLEVLRTSICNARVHVRVVHLGEEKLLECTTW